jgi:hypothetical protein
MSNSKNNSRSLIQSFLERLSLEIGFVWACSASRSENSYAMTEQEVTTLRAEILQSSFQFNPVRLLPSHLTLANKDSNIGFVDFRCPKDLLVSEALIRVLSSIFDSSFLACSYAFRKNLSLNNFLRDVSESVPNPFLVFHLNLDLSFDSLNRDRLLTKLDLFFHLHPGMHHLINSFLNNSKMDNSGKLFQINENKGIPPVGLLGMVLFNFYLDDLDLLPQSFPGTGSIFAIEAKFF